MQARIIRSKRKSIQITIQNDGSVLVNAPKNLSNPAIERFLNEKADWIHSTQRRILQNYVPPHRYQEGEIFYYLGKTFPLKMTSQQSPPLIMNGTFQLDRRYASRAMQIFERWYKNQARQIISERLVEISSQIGSQYKGIKITSAKKRWGSCSNRRTLNFSYRLVMAPPEVIDSVIIHELVHLDHPNHSPAFWKRFQEIMPDYRVHREWLQKNGDKLFL